MDSTVAWAYILQNITYYIW